MNRYLQQFVAIMIVVFCFGHSYSLSITTLAWWGWVLLGAIGLQVYGDAYHKLEAQHGN